MWSNKAREHLFPNSEIDVFADFLRFSKKWPIFENILRGLVLAWTIICSILTIDISVEKEFEKWILIRFANRSCQLGLKLKSCIKADFTNWGHKIFFLFQSHNIFPCRWKINTKTMFIILTIFTLIQNYKHITGNMR